MTRTERAPGRKRERLEARISAEQKTLFERAAAIQGRSLTEFVVRSVQEAAETTVREHDVLALTARDSALLVEALLHPPPPNECLREALRLHAESVESRP